jgi:hypothetical protein
VAACVGCGRTGVEASPTANPSPSPTAASPAPAGSVDASPVDASTSRATLHHVLGTGQSLAAGVGGEPPLSTTQPYANRMFATGVLAGGAALSSFVPLVERDVETMSSGLSTFVGASARAAGASHDLLVSVHAVGGQPYATMKKGTPTYATSIAQAVAGLGVARAAGLAYDVTAVTSADGGGDHVARNPHLDTDLAEWQRDFDADLRALTGQADPIPLFNTQYSSWTEYDAVSPVPLAQLRAHVDNPGKVVVVGPRYPFAYGPDGVHLTNHGYRQMGEYYAKAYRRVVLERGAWEPTRPRSVTRAGAAITVRFFVPAPPLVFDTTLARDPGHLGFEYTDDAPSPPAITGVALDGPDQVTVTLAAEPTGSNRRVRYAYTGIFGNKAGLQTGARGNLRDSDATPSRYGYPLYNWCVHFDEAVP